ncbi:hypothetical protein ES703_70110 [subsurface metagenome]
MDFTVGDLILIEVLIQQGSEKVELGTQAGIQVYGIIGKCEYKIAELTKAVQTQTPGGLKAPAAPAPEKT